MNSAAERCFIQLYGTLPEKWLPFAVIAARAGVRRKDLEKIIETVDKHPKITEFLPPFTLHNKETGWSIETLPLNDPTLFVAGYLTGCCQSIHGYGRQVALHIGESPFGSIVRIMKGNSWIAQGWAGLTLSHGQTEGELVIDSIEKNREHDKNAVLQMYKEAAEHILHTCPWIKRVLLGGGGGSQQLELKKLEQYKGPITAIGGFQGGGYDSKKQRYILAERENDDAAVVTELKLVLVNAKDSYVSKGQRIKTLSLDYPDKLALEKHAAAALKFLREEKLNPLAEEGFYKDEESRERLGELFLTHNAVTKLAEECLENKKEKDERYRFDSIISVDNDEEELARQLREKNLQQGQPQLILYTEGVHTVTAIVGTVAGKTVSFTVDFEPYRDADGMEVNKAIRTAFPDVQMACSAVRLQRDYYSYSTMALKALRFFAKQGDTLLTTVSKAYSDKEKRSSTGTLLIDKVEEMPASLLKMAQGIAVEKLPDPVLDSVVSSKKGTTLYNYLSANSITAADGRSYNGAALRKKWRYTHMLQTLLTPPPAPCPPQPSSLSKSESDAGTDTGAEKKRKG